MLLVVDKGLIKGMITKLGFVKKRKHNCFMNKIEKKKKKKNKRENIKKMIEQMAVEMAKIEIKKRFKNFY